MKRKSLLILLCLTVIFGQRITAQVNESELEFPKVSDDNANFWYYIMSADSEYAGKCITDINQSQSGIAKFGIEEKEDGNHYQQWKLIQAVNSENDNVHFVNRATENIIQTKYDFDGYFNAQSTKDPEESNGWKLEVISGNQIKISGKDDAGFTGYLNVSSTLKDAEPIPVESGFSESSYAWLFEKANWRTSIEEVNPFADVRIYTLDRRIIVEGTDDYTLNHISGIRVPKDKELPVGVYLVTIQGKTKTVLVK